MIYGTKFAGGGGAIKIGGGFIFALLSSVIHLWATAGNHRVPSGRIWGFNTKKKTSSESRRGKAEFAPTHARFYYPPSRGEYINIIYLYSGGGGDRYRIAAGVAYITERIPSPFPALKRARWMELSLKFKF